MIHCKYFETYSVRENVSDAVLSRTSIVNSDIYLFQIFISSLFPLPSFQILSEIAEGAAKHHMYVLIYYLQLHFKEFVLYTELSIQ